MTQVFGLEYFPGRVFNGDGEAIDRRRSDLTLHRIARSPFRAVVVRHAPLDIGLIWALWDAAEFEVVSPHMIGSATWRIMYSRQGVLIMGRKAEIVTEFRKGLMRELLLAENAEYVLTRPVVAT